MCPCTGLSRCSPSSSPPPSRRPAPRPRGTCRPASPTTRSCSTAGRGRTRRSQTGRPSGSTRSASRSRGRAWRRIRAPRRPRSASSRPIRTTRSTTGAPSTPRWTASSRRGSSRCSCSTARRRCGASGNPQRGNPRYRPSAPAFANFATAVAGRFGAAVDEYILWNEPNLPVWMQPQADCGVHRCTPVSPSVYRAMVLAAYPAIHAVDPVATVLIGALAPAGGDLKTNNANMRPLEFLRGLGCVDGDLHVVRTGACRGFQPAIADGISYHPHSTRHAPSQPYAHRDNADLGSLKKVERLIDRLQRLGRLRGHVDSAQPVAGRVRLPDQPARSPARRLARRPGPVSAAGRVHRLARPARHAPGAVPLAGRAGRGRAQVHRLAIGPARRRRRPEAGAGPLRQPDLVRLPRQHRVGPGPPRGCPPGPGPAPPRGRRDEPGSRSPRSRRGTTGRGRSPRRRSRSRRTAPSPTTAPRARR